MYSLSRTLSLRFAATMLIGMLVVGTSLLFTARRILRAELDRGLRAALELEIAALQAGQPIAAVNAWPTRSAFTRNVNRFVTIRDTLGNVVNGNTGAARLVPLDRAALVAAAHGERRWVSHNWDEKGLRSVYAPAPANRVLQVSAVSTSIDDVFTLLFGIMLGTVVATTGATAIGARWLARAATAPVSEITAQVGQIEEVTPGDRISAHTNAEEYRELVAVINGMLDRLQQASEMQRQITANTGHDIRTPLTVMQGELEVALRGTRSPDEYRRVLNSCLDEVRSLSSICDKMLLLARIESGSIQLQQSRLDLASVVTRIIDLFRTSDEQHAIEVVATVPEAAALADEFLFGVALREMLENAVRHTPVGTVVSVNVVPVDDWVQVTVEDSGPGVPDEHLELLFQRTHREDAARTRASTGGVGIGLAIVAAVIRLHRGGIHASQSDLGGLRLQVRLPSAQGGFPL